MVNKPQEHYPVLAFAIACAPLSAISLIKTECVVGVEMAAALALLGACSLVLGIVKYWRYDSN